MGTSMSNFYETSPLVSIIITTRNEQRFLEECLQSIKNQTYKNVEILVVDNNSGDNTKKIAMRYTKNVFNLGPERSSQRNAGVEKAKGDYIIYLDADMRLEPELVKKAVKQIQKEKIDALYISEVVMGDSFLSKIRRFERFFYEATVIDCARFIKRKAFLKVGGFDLNLTGPEDFDLDKKLKQQGYKLSLLKNSWLDHDESNINLKNYLNKKSYYSKSFDRYVAKWGKDDEDVKKQLGFYYRFIGVFTEKGKWKKLLRHPILTAGMYYLRFRVGLRYLRRKRRNRNGS